VTADAQSSLAASPSQAVGPGATSPGRRLLLAAVCCLGISSIVTQLVLMRELLCVLAGNEMILGIILGNWFLLTGLGAMLGRSSARLRRPVRVLVLAQLALAVVPVAAVVALRTLRNVVFVRGGQIGVAQSVVSCFLLLLPYCLIAGYLLTLACALLSTRKDAAGIGKVYFLDVLGDIAGGLLFTFVLMPMMGHFAILYVPAALNLASAVAVAAAGRRKLLTTVAAAVCLAAGALVAAVDLEELSTRIEYAGRDVRFRGHSPYGQLVVTASAGQYDFIENGVPLFSTLEPQRVEQTVHFALAQRPRARRVLLIGGGVSGTAAEILKYPVEAVDYVERDPLILEQGRLFAPGRLDDPRIRVHNTDGRLFVRRTAVRYGVVIVDTPDPSTSQLNRFYTAEFFRQAKRVLEPDGVLAISLAGYENYVSDELADLIGSADRTLKTALARVLLLPGRQVTLLASDGELTEDVAGRIEQAGVDTLWVRRELLVGELSEDRLAALRAAVDASAPVNEDFSPVLYYYHLMWWISRFKVRLGALAAVMAAGLLICLLRIRPVTFAVFTTGLAASALQVVLLVGFQIVHGSLYQRIALLVTMFMAGLAVGSHLANRRLDRLGRRGLARVQYAVAAYAVLLPIVLPALDAWGTPAGQWLSAWLAFPLLAMLPAVLVGLEFPLAGKVGFAGVAPTASRLYTADYLGACFGALLVSTLLIPLIGVVAVCLLAAAMNLAGGLVIRFTTGR